MKTENQKTFTSVMRQIKEDWQQALFDHLLLIMCIVWIGFAYFN